MLAVVGFASELVREKFFSRRLRANLALFVLGHEMVQHDLGEPLLIPLILPRIGRHTGQDHDPCRCDACLKRGQVDVVVRAVT